MQNNTLQTNSPRQPIDRYSIGKSSEYLGVSIDTLRRWEKKKVITAYRSPGGHRYFLKNDLDNLFGQKYTRTSPTKKREPVAKTADVPKITSIPKTDEPQKPPPVPTQQPSTYAVVQEITQTQEPPPPPQAVSVAPPPPQTSSEEFQQSLTQVVGEHKKAPAEVLKTKVKKDLSWSTVLLIGLILFAIADIVLLIVYFTSNNSLISPVP